MSEPSSGTRTSRRCDAGAAVPYEVPRGWSLRDEDGAAGVPKALRSSCQEALLPEGLPARQGMVHTSLPSRCEAATVVASATATAPLQRSPRDRCGHRSVGGRRPLQHPQRDLRGAVAEELTQRRGGMVHPRQDSRLRGPSAPLQSLSQPGPRV